MHVDESGENFATGRLGEPQESVSGLRRDPESDGPPRAAKMVSLELSRAIYDDARRAYEDIGHPCHAFRYRQDGVDDDRWQLPEPFNGRPPMPGSSSSA